MSQRELFPTFVFYYSPIRSPSVSVFLSKQSRLKFIPFIPGFFQQIRATKSQNSSQKIRKSMFFQQQTHAPTQALYISAKSEDAAHCGRFGALGTKKHTDKDGARKAWLVFSRFSSILQGQQRLQVDHTVRTIKGIVLRSVRSACGNGLPYICHLVSL